MKKKNSVYIIEIWLPVGQRGKKVRYGWVPWSIGYDFRAARMQIAEERERADNKFRITRYEATR